MRNKQSRAVETAMSDHSEALSFSRKTQTERMAVETVVKRPIVFARFAGTSEYETRRKPVQRARNTAIEMPFAKEAGFESQKVPASSFPLPESLRTLRRTNTAAAVRNMAHSAKKRLQTGEAVPVFTT